MNEYGRKKGTNVMGNAHLTIFVHNYYYLLHSHLAQYRNNESRAHMHIHLAQQQQQQNHRIG